MDTPGVYGKLHGRMVMSTLKKIFGACVCVLMLGAPAFSAGEEDTAGKRHWGFAYPGGYDINTVRTLEGSVVRFERPEHGPVTLEIRDNRRTYVVLAGPHWFWREAPLWVEGERIRVKGSLVQGRDGSLYVMAAEISDPGPDGQERMVRLRNKRGEPLWMGRHGMMGGRGRGMMR